MTVYFIGAGPGDPDLLTIRGRDLIERCQLCLYAGSLVPEAVVRHAGEGTRLVSTASLSLADIIGHFEVAAEAGEDVARVHSGDPAIYSAVTEQVAALNERGIAYEIVPGVPSYAAAAARLGQELTMPGVAQTVILTRVEGRATSMPEGEDLATLAASRATLALHLAAKALPKIVNELRPFYGGDCPVAIVARATWPDEIILRGTLDTIAEVAAEAGIERTAMIFVGRVLDARSDGTSALYSAEHARHLKPAR